jgi:hypothetical protein
VPHKPSCWPGGAPVFAGENGIAERRAIPQKGTLAGMDVNKDCFGKAGVEIQATVPCWWKNKWFLLRFNRTLLRRSFIIRFLPSSRSFAPA